MKLDWKDRYGTLFTCGDYRIVKRKYYDTITESSKEVWVTYFRDSAISIADTLETAKLHARIDADDHCEVVSTPFTAYKVVELVGEDSEGKTQFYRSIIKFVVPANARVYRVEDKLKTDEVSNIEIVATITPTPEELINLRICTVEDFERYVSEAEDDDPAKFIPTYYALGQDASQKVIFDETPRIRSQVDFSCTTFFPNTLSGIDSTVYGSMELPN